MVLPHLRAEIETMSMKGRKIHLENVTPTAGNSFTIRKFNRQFSTHHSVWHAHPEYEIVYISKGRGNRHISNSLSTYDDGDLVFLGPNLPHFGFTEHLEEDHDEVVIQMRADFLGTRFLDKPEFEDIARLFQKAKNGLSFYGAFKHEIGSVMLEMAELKPLERLLKLIEILHRMAESDNVIHLHAEKTDYIVDSIDGDRLNSISRYINKHYMDSLTLNDIATEVGMTVPAFCRYFKRVSKKTFNQFLNEYRVSQACRLIKNESYTLAAISQDCGFSNISNFNKQFKRIMNETPSHFRKRQSQTISV